MRVVRGGQVRRAWGGTRSEYRVIGLTHIGGEFSSRVVCERLSDGERWEWSVETVALDPIVSEVQS